MGESDDRSFYTKKIGFGGFQDFKKELIRFESVQTKIDDSLINTPKEVTYAQFVKSLSETKGFIDEEMIPPRCETAYSGPKDLCFCSRYLTGITAQHISNRFNET